MRNLLTMAIDNIPLILFATLLRLLYYWCFYLRHPRRRSYADHMPHPPAPVHSPLHPALIELLPTSTYSYSSSSSTTTVAKAEEHSHPPPECAICLIEFKEGDIGRVLPNCDHFFHLNCIDKWLRTNKTCPMCRNVVNPPLLRITSSHENTEAHAREEEDCQFENSSNVNLPSVIWCPRNTRQVIELEQVVIEIPEEENRGRQRQRM